MLTQAERDPIANIHRQLMQRHAAIDSRMDLNVQGKRARRAREQLAAEEAVKKITDASDARHAQASRAAYYKCFGMKSTGSGDVLADRDARQFAAGLKSPGDALKALSAADLRGDVSLSRAIAERAWSERGPGDLGGQWQKVLHAYADANPQRNAALGELAGLEHSKADRLTDSLYRHPSRPSDLQHADLAAVAASTGGTQAGQ